MSAEIPTAPAEAPRSQVVRSNRRQILLFGALTLILDTCALTMAGIDDACAKQAELTFAIARHAIADLAQVFAAAPLPLPEDRLPPEQLRQLRSVLANQGMQLHDSAEADRKLNELRAMYEPYVYSLANYLSQPLPPWIPAKKRKDNWQTTAWTGNLREGKEALVRDDHF